MASQRAIAQGPCSILKCKKCSMSKASTSSGGEQDKPADVIVSRINLMREVLYNKELLTQVAQEFHLYGYEKANATAAID